MNEGPYNILKGIECNYDIDKINEMLEENHIDELKSENKKIKE